MKCIQCGNCDFYIYQEDVYKNRFQKRKKTYRRLLYSLYVDPLRTENKTLYRMVGRISPPTIYKWKASKTETRYCYICGRILETDPKQRVYTNIKNPRVFK